LEPERAFQIKASARDAATVVVEWAIADGYYMYRDKFRFQSDSPGVTLGTPNIPPGKIKQDEFFGEVETYRQRVAVEIPVQGAATDAIEITASSQGCADIGVCYPPLTQKVRVELPALQPATAPSQPAARSGILAGLAKLGSGLGLGGAQDEFLEPDQAFVFSATAPAADALLVRWEIADGYYLYRSKLAFELKGVDGVTLGQAELPAGKIKEDEYFGRQEVYYRELEARLPVQATAGAIPASLTLQATYQGCAEAGICYPPMTKTVNLTLPGTSLPATAAQTAPQPPLSEQDEIASRLAAGSTLLTIITFFGFGLLLSLTPCVFPMIPILSSIIVGQGAGLTARKGFTLSLVYVLAMALTYTAAGVVAGLFGSNLQATFQNPWILGSFAGIFVLLSLSMFGFYDLQMPSSIQSKLTEISNRQQGGTLVGVGIMGFLSALIVGPCVAAPLAGALIYIGQTGDAVLGGIALFALSMGMGAPLLAIGTSAGKLLPKVGGWMNTIKAVFGVLMLGVAIWMLERILPGPVTLLLWAALLIVSAIYMGALEQLGPDATGWRKLWKGVGLVMLIYGALLTVGAAGGGSDMFQPLRGINLVAANAGGNPMAGTESMFKQVKGLPELERELAAARSAGRPVMFDLYADWCVSCKELEKYTFSDPGVRQALATAVLLQSDVTAWDDSDQKLAKAYGLIGPPAILFFGKDGQERRNYRVVGFMEAERFRAHAEQALQ
ncbi:MAG: protein-disulfide reductase DsbD, partial [Gammaproteobacteria bacterium]